VFPFPSWRTISQRSASSKRKILRVFTRRIFVGPNAIIVSQKKENVNKYLVKITIFCKLNKKNLFTLYNFPSCKGKKLVLLYSQKGWYQCTTKTLKHISDDRNWYIERASQKAKKMKRNQSKTTWLSEGCKTIKLKQNRQPKYRLVAYDDEWSQWLSRSECGMSGRFIVRIWKGRSARYARANIMAFSGVSNL